MTIVKLKKLESSIGLTLPSYATIHSAGMDLIASNFTNIVIEPGSVVAIPTGISIALEDGFEAQVRPRSGLALKNNITILNSPGTIDSDYRGEIKVILINHSNVNFIVERGMKIAQMIISKYEKISFEEVEILDETERGIGGFGSTGN